MSTIMENGALTADNKIFLDQFTLGEKIDSEPDRSISLAIALLKNRRGEINIHLPLKGIDQRSRLQSATSFFKQLSI